MTSPHLPVSYLVMGLKAKAQVSLLCFSSAVMPRCLLLLFFPSLFSLSLFFFFFFFLLASPQHMDRVPHPGIRSKLQLQRTISMAMLGLGSNLHPNTSETLPVLLCQVETPALSLLLAFFCIHLFNSKLASEYLKLIRTK